MEGINNRENFESFKNRIAETFQKEGLSENLKSEIEIWKKRKYEETDTPSGTIEQRVNFQIEHADLLIATEQYDWAWEILDEAAWLAHNAGLDKLNQEIKNFMRDHWNWEKE